MLSVCQCISATVISPYSIPQAVPHLLCLLKSDWKSGYMILPLMIRLMLLECLSNAFHCSFKQDFFFGNISLMENFFLDI